MFKIGSEQISLVATRSAAVMRGLIGENEELRSKLASAEDKISGMERTQRIEKIAHDMEVKGLNADTTFEEKVAHLAQYEDLVPVEQAVKMASASGIHLAEVSDMPGRGQGGALDSFYSFCIGQENGEEA